MLITQTDFDIIDSNILINIISNLDIKNIDILNIVCSEHTANINKKILKNLEINFITKKMLYLDFFNKHNIYPNKENIVLNKPTFCLKNFLYSLFLPNKAKGYFFCGSILLFSSIILPYHYYYIIVGSILVLFGIICKILPNVKN